MVLKVNYFRYSNYLENRDQRVALNSQIYDWRKVNSGVPQG